MRSWLFNLTSVHICSSLKDRQWLKVFLWGRMTWIAFPWSESTLIWRSPLELLSLTVQQAIITKCYLNFTQTWCSDVCTTDRPPAAWCCPTAHYLKAYYTHTYIHTTKTQTHAYMYTIHKPYVSEQQLYWMCHRRDLNSLENVDKWLLSPVSVLRATLDSSRIFSPF